MATPNEPADPLAKGTLATAKQAWKDLFIWEQRVVVINEYGEEHTEWQAPEPLKNPVSLMAQLSAKVRTIHDHEYFFCQTSADCNRTGSISSWDSLHGLLMHSISTRYPFRPPSSENATTVATPTSPRPSHSLYCFARLEQPYSV